MRLNFTIEYVQPNLSLSHNEALMSMDYFDADIYGITLLSPSTARKEHVDFTKTIYSSYQRFFKRELGISKTDYFSMLSRDLWLAILLALLILALYALCQSRTNAYENNLLHIGILCLSISQSYDITLRYSVSFKILIFTSSLFCFMLITVFSARTTSVLNVKQQEDPINSLEDIINQNLKLYISPGGFTENYFSTAKEGMPAYKVWHEQVKAFF